MNANKINALKAFFPDNPRRPVMINRKFCFRTVTSGNDFGAPPRPPAPRLTQRRLLPPPPPLPDPPEAPPLPQVLIHYPDVRLPTAEGERPPLYATTLDLGSELVTVSSPTPFRARIHRFSY